MAENTVMPPLKEHPPSVQLWVNEKDKIVSFHVEEGFHTLSFPSRDAMFSFVFEKGSSGFRIQ